MGILGVGVVGASELARELKREKSPDMNDAGKISSRVFLDGEDRKESDLIGMNEMQILGRHDKIQSQWWKNRQDSKKSVMAFHVCNIFI